MSCFQSGIADVCWTGASAVSLRSGGFRQKGTSPPETLCTWTRLRLTPRRRGIPAPEAFTSALNARALIVFPSVCRSLSCAARAGVEQPCRVGEPLPGRCP